ncbi:MAG: AAA family ATPase [Lachnospiraceae bacterium]|jgi:chromosome partitioning protein
MGATIYCLCNQKGGCAKTVTSVNLGIGLAREGKRVLVVDVDSQGSLTASLGWQQPDQIEVTLATILDGILEDKPLLPESGILHHAEGIDVLPANIELSGLEVTLVNTMSRETILRQYLNTVRDKYDVIILDCMPSLGMLTINALAAADQVIIPVQAQFLSIKGLEQLIRTVAKVKRQINPSLSISGIVITMADMRTNYAKDIVELLHNNYDGKLRIFQNIIPLSVRTSESNAAGKSIYLHDPTGKVASAYAALTKEVLEE